MKEFFEILELSRNATKEDIKNAYRRLAKKYHPDINHSKNAQDKFIAITEAYEFLMNHEVRQHTRETGQVNQEPTSSDHQANEEFERFRRETREKAKRQSEMRYEEFKKQHESFQESGVNDLALLFKILVRIAIIPLSLFLLALPVYITLNNEWTNIFILLVTWPFAGILVWYIYDNRKGYFMPGKFYYSLERIKHIYSERVPTTQQCYYCYGEKADSRPYKVELLRQKDIKLRTGGFQQHNVSYVNESVIIAVPRSRKAFIVHSLITVVKIVSILFFLIFTNISSTIWKIIFGFITGGLLGSLILVLTRTRSNVSHLFNYGTIVRICIWFLSVLTVSVFHFSPFDVSTSDFIYFVITSILLFDCLLMQLTDLLMGRHSPKRLFEQYPDLNKKLNDGFIEYNEVPVVSVIFPVFKWIIG